MDFDDKRTLFWKKFIRYANIQPNSSVGDEIDLEAFSRDHAIQIFAKNDFRLKPNSKLKSRQLSLKYFIRKIWLLIRKSY